MTRRLGAALRRIQPTAPPRDGPLPSTFDTPAISGDSAHPSPRNHAGGPSITTQSSAPGRVPPTTPAANGVDQS